MLLPLTVSCFSKIQIGFTILAPAHPGSPGQRVVKQMCVCVCLGPEKLCQNMHCLTSPVTVTIVAFIAVVLVQVIQAGSGWLMSSVGIESGKVLPVKTCSAVLPACVALHSVY